MNQRLTSFVTVGPLCLLAAISFTTRTIGAETRKTVKPHAQKGRKSAPVKAKQPVKATSFAMNHLQVRGETPTPWALDVLSLLLVSAVAYGGALRVGLGRQRQELHTLRQHHENQLNALITRSEELETQNGVLDAQCEKQVALTAEMQEEALRRTAEHEAETRKLTEEVLAAVEATTEANARQLDAVNMALRYQRSELRQIRHGFNDLMVGSATAHIARAMPAEFTAISGAIGPGENSSESESGTVPPLDLTVNSAATVVMDTMEYEIVPLLAMVHAPSQDAAGANEGPHSGPKADGFSDPGDHTRRANG